MPQPELLDPALLASVGVALGAGLLIGIERERRKGTGPRRSFAGVRTFSMAALMGTVTQTLGQPWLVLLAALLLLVLCAVHYLRDRSTDPGVTTELALFVTFLLGVLAVAHPAQAAAIAVVVAALLFLRGPLHRFSTELLTPHELQDALVLAGAALIVLPLLPATPIAWLAELDVRRLWLLAVAFMGVQALGHIGLRALGARLGLPLSGLMGGFVSSSATIAGLGARVRKTPPLLHPAVTGAWCSTVATAAQLGLVGLTINPAMLMPLRSVLLAMVLAALLLSAAGLRASRVDAPFEPPTHAFDPLSALGLALLLAAVTVGVGLLARHQGGLSVLLAIGVAGLADAHAAAASALSLAASGALDQERAVQAVLLAISTNTATKMALAFASGGWRFGAITSVGLAVILLAAWLPVLGWQ